MDKTTTNITDTFCDTVENLVEAILQAFKKKRLRCTP